MEALKTYILNNICFEEREKYGDFEKQLFSFLDTHFVYYSTCKRFFEISPIACIKLATMNGEEIDQNREDFEIITDYARRGAENLIFCCMYSELLKAYNKAQKRGRKQ